jgi:hypothetical protein
MLDGVALTEGWCASLEAIPPEYSERRPDEGVLRKRYEPTRRAPLPTDAALGLELGSVIEVDLEPELARDATRLELRCGQRRTLALTPVVELLRDPSWERFLRDEIIDRLRHNRIRFAGSSGDGGLDQVLAAVQDEYRQRGLDTRVVELGDGLGASVIEVSTGSTAGGRRLAYLGQLDRPSEQPEQPSGFVLLAGPPRYGGDELLQVLRARLASSGLGVVQLRALPEPAR